MSVDLALSLQGLSVEHDGVVALRSVDLTVAPGEVLALLGPSGSGKSTLLHTVAGFLTPSGGSVHIGGRLVASPSRAVAPEHREVAVVFQNYALWPHLSAVDTVAYPLRRGGLGRAAAQQQAMVILDRLRIAHLAHRRPAELSGGEQQRVGLGRALARDASLYLFDEPTAHLDTHVRGVFLEELVLRQRASGAAAVYATHDAEEALGLADRVALLNAGRVVQVGTAQQVYDEPVNAWAARLTGPASVLVPEPGGGRVLVRPGWAHLGGPLAGTLRAVWFRGPHSDYLVETRFGRVLIREPGTPQQVPGAELSWALERSWALDSGEAKGSEVGVEV
jgi:iron(III) transport system ATP-binding protein